MKLSKDQSIDHESLKEAEALQAEFLAKCAEMGPQKKERRKKGKLEKKIGKQKKTQNEKKLSNAKEEQAKER